MLAGEIGRSYRFQFAPDSTGPDWTDITNFTALADTVQLIDPTVEPAARRFYRVVSP